MKLEDNSKDSGIMKGKRKPDYGISRFTNKSSNKRNDYTFTSTCFISVILYFVILQIAGIEAALSSLGAMLLGVIIGLFVAVSMTAGGGAWDNAKNTLKMVILAEKVLKHINQL